MFAALMGCAYLRYQVLPLWAEEFLCFPANLKNS